jgi:hypothetical protein
MFEWPKAKEGEILVPLPFKIFWATSIPLAAIIGFLMWLISEGEKRDWKLPLLPSSKASGYRPGNNASGSGASRWPSHPTAPFSNPPGCGVGLPPGTPLSGSVGKDKTIANGRSPIRSPKLTADIERGHVEL